MTKNKTFYLSLISIPFLLQFLLSFLLLDNNYFNDELEAMAGSTFFSDAYLTQFNTHGPGQILLSKIWFSFFDVTFFNNRMMAATLNCIFFYSTWKICSKFARSPKEGIIGYSVACISWLVFETQFWGYLNVTQLQAMVIMVLLIATAFERSSQGVIFANPTLTAFLLVLVTATRYVQAIQILVIVIFIFVWRKINPEGVKFSEKYRLKFALSALLTIALVALIFSNRLKDLIYWSLLHNFKMKTGNVSISAWIGDISTDANLILVCQILLLFIILNLSLVSIYGELNQGSRFISHLLLVTAFGGWLACNPSGLGSAYFQAIQAIGPLCLSVGIIFSYIFRSYDDASVKNLSGKFGALACMTLILILHVPSIQPTLRNIAATDAAQAKLSTEEKSEYIKAHSKISDKILVFGTNSMIYSLSERRSSTFASFLFVDQGMYHERLYNEFIRNSPKFIVFDSKDVFFDSNLAQFWRTTSVILSNYAITPIDGLLVRKSPKIDSQLGPILTQHQLDLLNASSTKNGEECMFSLKPRTSLTQITGRKEIKFQEKDSWAETQIPVPINVAGKFNSNDLIRITFSKEAVDFFDRNSRFLRLGVWFDGHMQDWTWFQFTEKNRSFEFPISALFGGNRPSNNDFQLFLGGWGPENFSLEVERIDFYKAEVRSNCSFKSS